MGTQDTVGIIYLNNDICGNIAAFFFPYRGIANHTDTQNKCLLSRGIEPIQLQTILTISRSLSFMLIIEDLYDIYDTERQHRFFCALFLSVKW